MVIGERKENRWHKAKSVLDNIHKRDPHARPRQEGKGKVLGTRNLVISGEHWIELLHEIFH